MADDQVKNEEEIQEDAALQDLDLEEEIEEDALTAEEMDEVDEVEEEEEKPEVGAVLVLGQGDFSMRESNRGADDPGDNTLSEPQAMTRFGDMLFIADRGNHRVLVWNTFPEE